MLDNNEIQRLAVMGSALRPDWPARSLATFLGKHFGDRAYGDVAVALAWVCTRTKTETPRLLLEAGPWWKAAALDAGGHAPRPPRAEEACHVCGRRREGHNGPILGDHEFAPPRRRQAGEPPDWRAINNANAQAAAKARAAREELLAARSTLCPCGIRPEKCAEHRPQPAKPETEETETA